MAKEFTTGTIDERFIKIVYAKTAQEAFDLSRRLAKEDGPNRYTGTIANKSDYVMLEKDCDTVWYEWAEKYLAAHKGESINNVNGTVGCVDLKDGSFLFFGHARKGR